MVWLQLPVITRFWHQMSGIDTGVPRWSSQCLLKSRPTSIIPEVRCLQDWHWDTTLIMCCTLHSCTLPMSFCTCHIFSDNIHQDDRPLVERNMLHAEPMDVRPQGPPWSSWVPYHWNPLAPAKLVTKITVLFLFLCEHASMLFSLLWRSNSLITVKLLGWHCENSWCRLEDVLPILCL